MSFNLKLMQLLQVEEVQYLQSPTPLWLTLHLTEEGQSLLFCRPRWCPGRNLAHQSLWLMSQILNTTLWQQILLRSSHKVLDVFSWVKLTLVSISPYFTYFFIADNNSDLTASWESAQSSEVAQACARSGRNEQVCLIFKCGPSMGHFSELNKVESRRLCADGNVSVSRRLLPMRRRRMLQLLLRPPVPRGQ